MTWSFLAVITQMPLLTDRVRSLRSVGEYVIKRCRRQRSGNLWELSVPPPRPADVGAVSKVGGVISADMVKERSGPGVSVEHPKH